MQAIKGDFAEGGWWVISLLFGSRTKEEDAAWKALVGKPREKAMYQWVFEAKQILDEHSPQDIAKLLQQDKKIKNKPSIKILKILYSYLDHFLVIQRQHRHYSRSYITESLPSVTKSIIGDDMDSFHFMQMASNELKKKGNRHVYKLIKLYNENLNFVNFGGIVKQGNIIRVDDLKTKIQAARPPRIDSNPTLDTNHSALDIPAFNLNNYSTQH